LKPVLDIGAVRATTLLPQLVRPFHYLLCWNSLRLPGAARGRCRCRCRPRLFRNACLGVLC